MTNAVRAELRKFLTTRLWWGMAIAVVASGMLFAALNAFFLTSSEFSSASGLGALDDLALARSVYTGGIQIAYLITLAIGVMAIGAEYRHKTITSTFLAVPRRGRLMAAKGIALLGISAAYGVLSLLSSTAVGAALLAARGRTPFPDGAIWRTLALGLLVLAVWGLIGLGAGILIPNQVAALLIAIGVAWIVEPLLTLLLSNFSWGRSSARFFPSSATTATLELPTGTGFGADLAVFPWWGGALVLVGYAAAMALVGTALTVRRDVS